MGIVILLMNAGGWDGWGLAGLGWDGWDGWAELGWAALKADPTAFPMNSTQACLGEVPRPARACQMT